ncbi:MAG: tripartite tricarboxylate transporter substrate-binding protein [Acetobacteraceae bacterium]
MLTRRQGLAGILALGSLIPPARAAERVTLLVGAPSGSRQDRIARWIAPFLARQAPFADLALRNVPGDGGLVALNALAEAPPGGATLGWVSTPSLAARMVDRGDPTLAQRLTLLGAIMREPIAFVSPAAEPLDSVQDIIRRASEDADAVPLGTPPPGSPPHLAALKLQAVSQTRLTIVTFPSAAAARGAVLAGNVSAAALGLSDVIEALREDRLHGVGLAARNRFGMLPDLPVLKEAGVPLAASVRHGLAAPAGIGAEAAERLAAALRLVCSAPAFREWADSNGFIPVWTDGRTWTAQMEAERADLARLWATDPWLPSSSG